jgi:hypothetical protein
LSLISDSKLVNGVFMADITEQRLQKASDTMLKAFDDYAQATVGDQAKQKAFRNAVDDYNRAVSSAVKDGRVRVEESVSRTEQALRDRAIKLNEAAGRITPEKKVPGALELFTGAARAASDKYGDLMTFSGLAFETSLAISDNAKNRHTVAQDVGGKPSAQTQAPAQATPGDGLRQSLEAAARGAVGGSLLGLVSPVIKDSLPTHGGSQDAIPRAAQGRPAPRHAIGQEPIPIVRPTTLIQLADEAFDETVKNGSPDRTINVNMGAEERNNKKMVVRRVVASVLSNTEGREALEASMNNATSRDDRAKASARLDQQLSNELSQLLKEEQALEIRVAAFEVLHNMSKAEYSAMINELGLEPTPGHAVGQESISGASTKGLEGFLKEHAGTGDKRSSFVEPEVSAKFKTTVRSRFEHLWRSRD